MASTQTQSERIKAAKARIADLETQQRQLHRADGALLDKLREQCALWVKEYKSGLSAEEKQRFSQLNNDLNVAQWLEINSAITDLERAIREAKTEGSVGGDVDAPQDGSPSSVIAPHASQHAFSAMQLQPPSNAASLPSTSVPAETLNLEPGILSCKRQFSVVRPVPKKPVNPVNEAEDSGSLSAVLSSVGKFLKEMLGVAPPQPETASTPTAARKLDPVKKD